MKLKHRITGTILAIAFATTSALPAAGIPNLKSPPKTVSAPRVPAAVAAPRIPVVPKVVNIPKVVAAPKVPVIPKVVSAPKIPAAPRIVTAPKVPSVKVPVAPKILAIKTPVAPKVPTIAKIPTLKVPTAPKIISVVKAPAIVRLSKTTTAIKAPSTTKVPASVIGIANAPAANINTGKLKNLKERLTVEMKPVETRTIVVDGVSTQVGGGGKGGRFLNDNFGGARPNQPGTFMEGVRSNSGGHDKNPLSSIPFGGGMVTTRGGAASDDPAGSEDTSMVDAVINWAMSVIGTGTGGPGTQSGAGTAASGTFGSFASTAFGILTSNTGSVDDKKNEANGIFGIFRQGKTGTSNENASSQLNQVEYQEPVPDDVGSSGSGIVTKGDIKGLEARKNQHSQPTGEESASGGHINTGANGTGKLGSLAQPAGDGVRSAVRMTAEDMRAMQVRINARINPAGR